MTHLGTQKPEPAEATVFNRFAAVADAFPVALAYTNGAVALTYSELAARARQARAQILVHGPASPGFVGILTTDRVNALTAMLGAAGSGHAYVLLDADDPDKRLGHILHEVRPFAILADAALLARAGALGAGHSAILDLDRRDTDAGPELHRGLPVSPGSLLYVSYTSGSTGVPKGVCQTHRNLGFYVDAYIDTMRIGAGDRISWLFAHGASASNMDIYGALFTGARLCAFEVRNESFAAMAQWIDDQRIGLLHTVPTVIRELAGAVAKDRLFGSVRTIDLAGEMLFASDVARIRPHVSPGCRIFNRLAATEASFISSLRVTRAHEEAEGALPVGKPPKGVEVAVLRADGTAADIGETGTIAIASPHICTGYLNRPDLNAELFADVQGRAGWRRFKSADLGFIDPSGNLNFIGRSGSRIKLRGQAVDLAEVETALYDCPNVTGAVVLPRGESGEEAREILAYLTLAEGTAPEAGEIRRQLARSLPTSMLPGGYVFLDQFPYTATSKVDRRALAALDLAKVRYRPGYAPPEDELEERVAAIFAEVLKLPSIGRFDDYFLLGGDSLRLVDLQLFAMETFGEEFPRLHEDATVKGIAERLRKAPNRDAIHAPMLLPIRTEGSAPPLFIVHGRRGIAHVSPYFLELLGDEQPLYALQARGLDGRQEPHRTVEEMAADYVAAIKTVQPEGPYFLGGLCVGCYVALEMVRLLFRQGEKYYAPLLIDPPPPEFRKKGEEISEKLMLQQLQRRVKSGAWKVDLHNADAIEAALRVARAFQDALVAYKAEPIRVRSMIIATKKRWNTAEVVQTVFGPQVEIDMIEVDHLEMMSPKNRQLADAIRTCVGQAARAAEQYRAMERAAAGRDSARVEIPRRAHAGQRPT